MPPYPTDDEHEFEEDESVDEELESDDDFEEDEEEVEEPEWEDVEEDDESDDEEEFKVDDEQDCEQVAEESDEELESESESELENDSDEDDYEQEDDEEMSLESLGQAYAAAIGTTPNLPSEDTEAPSDLVAESANLPKSKKKEVNWEDVLEQELRHCPISPESIVEAILFLGAPKGVKLTSRKIASILRDVSPKEITQIAKQLRQHYEDEEYAFRVDTERGVHRLELNKDLAPVQRHFLGRDKPVKLNQAVIDVLAIVAYNQPISREQVDKMRARTSGGILNQLVRRDLLAIRQTDEKPKRRLFETTERFLDLFDLDSLEDLPEIELYEE